MTVKRAEQIDDVKRRVDGLGSRFRVEWRKLRAGGACFDMATCPCGDALLDSLIGADPSTPAVRDERLPYWTEIWPSAVAVAERIMREGASLAGLQVLDLGCGLGLAGVAAGRCGARVCLCDYDLHAVRFAALNWAVNVGGTPWAVVMDWREPAFEPVFDRVLAADIVYEKRFFGPVIRACDRLLKPGGEVWLGEPNRTLSTGFFGALTKAGFHYEREEHRVELPNPQKPTVISVYRIYREKSGHD